MEKKFKTHLHPLNKAKALDSGLRRLLQNPKKILKKYIRSDMKVLDLGCGTGYFTIAIAKLLGPKGKVIAADVQKGMLDILAQKLQGNSSLEERIEICHNKEDVLPNGIFDFVLAFYSFHEIKYIDEIVIDLKSKIKPKTKILVAEQKFHVPKHTFKLIVQKMKEQDFQVVERPYIFFSRAVVLQLSDR